MNKVSTKKSKSGKRSNKTRSIQINSKTNQRDLDRRINAAIKMIEQPRARLAQTPLYKYIAGLLDFNEVAPSMLTPLTPGKKHLKTIRVTQTIPVSSAGALFIGIVPDKSASVASTSTYFFYGYNNAATYDPNDTTGTTGTVTKSSVIADALSLSSTSIPYVRLNSLHMRFKLTGVSNLNKQGTIYLMETLVNDASTIAPSAATFNIPYAPLCEVYKSMEIVNMDLNAHMQYNYFPLSNQSLATDHDAVTSYTTSSTYGGLYKQFALIVSGAAVGTSVKIDLEMDVECEVERGFVNTYPVSFSNCFLDSNPTLQYLNQHPDLRIQTMKKRNINFLPTVFNQVATQQKELVLFKSPFDLRSEDSSAYSVPKSMNSRRFVVK